MDEKTIARFWKKVDKAGPVPAHCPELGPCWVWTAARFKTGGYGAFGIGTTETAKSVARAHRVSWLISNGLLLDGECVLHRCDNPACVRPAHLFIGDRAVNNDDMRRKNRHSHGKQHGARIAANQIRGSDHVAAKITEATVREIKSLRAAGRSQSSIARAVGIDTSQVSRIVRGLAWAHVV